jgi:hypothetical protein
MQFIVIAHNSTVTNFYLNLIRHINWIRLIKHQNNVDKSMNVDNTCSYNFFWTYTGVSVTCVDCRTQNSDFRAVSKNGCTDQTASTECVVRRLALACGADVVGRPEALNLEQTARSFVTRMICICRWEAGTKSLADLRHGLISVSGILADGDS